MAYFALIRQINNLSTMEIPEIKQSLSIETMLNHYGLKPNRNNMLSCPFHKDDKPSLKIYPKTNSFNCFGCDAGGDQIEFTPTGASLK
jgi:DNA primase